jgi:hypothetical protein
VLLVAGGVTYLLVRDTGGGTANVTLTSPVVTNPTGQFAISTVPTAYNVVYRFDSYGSSGTNTTTEEFTVQRPFNGKVVAKSGAPPGTDRQWQATSNFGLYESTTAQNSSQVQHAAPQPALGDFRLDATLSDLVSTGTFAARERRTVLGRECQVYRTGQPLESFSTQPASATDYTDVCIDSSGLMLEEVSVQAGKLAERVIATSVDDHSTPADGTFTISGTPATIANGGSEFTAIDANAAPAPGYWVLGTIPDGYQHQGRYLLRVQANSPASSAPTTTTTTVAGAAPVTADGWVDVYVNGDKTIIIQQGPTAAEPQNAPTTGASVQIGSLGSAQATTELTANLLIAHPATPGAWFVSVTGTVPMATLQQIAGTMHQ